MLGGRGQTRDQTHELVSPVLEKTTVAGSFGLRARGQQQACLLFLVPDIFSMRVRVLPRWGSSRGNSGAAPVTHSVEFGVSQRAWRQLGDPVPT